MRGNLIAVFYYYYRITIYKIQALVDFCFFQVLALAYNIDNKRFISLK